MQERLSVILVEDDKGTVDEIEEYFKDLDNIEIIKTTNSSLQALEYVHDLNPDAIILDLELHNGSGSGVAFLIGMKEMSLDKTPYVLVTTNNSSQTTYDAIRKLGADFILYKHQTNYSPKNVAEILIGIYAVRTFTEEAEDPKPKHNNSDLNVRKRICLELELVSISPKLRGYSYLADAIEIYARGNTANISMEIGEKYNKSRDSVERAMQNAINKAWRSADIDTLRVNYTAHINPSRGVPTIMEFVSYYANKITNDIQ